MERAVEFIEPDGDLVKLNEMQKEEIAELIQVVPKKKETGKKMLVIDDSDQIRWFLRHVFASEYHVSEAHNGQEGVEIARVERPDFILCDVMMPVKDGLATCREIKGIPELAQVPVVLLTAKVESEDVIAGIECGADDYITKPYNPTILMLRISAVIKRTRKQDSSEADTGEKGIYQYRQAAVNTAKGTLSRGEKELVLTKNEMIIFLSLLNNIGKIVSRDELMTALWDNEEYINDNALTVNISRLRAKLSDFGYEDAIETRKKQGYCLV